MTEIAHVPPEAAPDGRQERFGRVTDNRLVRAVGRVRLPLGAKLLIGFAIVGTLLATGYVLGFVALGQSNSRSEQLRGLQERATYAQLLESNAALLASQVGERGQSRHTGTGGGAYNQALDNAVFPIWTRFVDSVPEIPTPANAQFITNADSRFVLKLQATLASFEEVWKKVVASDQTTPYRPEAALKLVNRAAAIEQRATSQVMSLAQQTAAQSDALVAANQSSFSSSRDLLLGVGVGSFVLALLLGLLLAWSVVAPLRRTESRLDEIAAGEFAGRLEVANRDEIGRLAAKVNRMSDELQRVYRELELASENKSQFVANMSHELRTPLNAIIGFSEVLQEQMFGELNERQLAYVNDVLEAGKHLLSLINDVLDLAKIEAGRMELDLSEVALPRILRSAVSLHSERARQEGVELSLTTEPEEITITADERRVRQIVFNLVSNAVKFTPAEGRVDIAAQVEDGHVEVAVADTGPGIAADELEAIFEEFEQTSEGKSAEGTGLGLPLSRKLVELHGGRLWVESEVGKGSTFRFTLPLETPA